MADRVGAVEHGIENALRLLGARARTASPRACAIIASIDALAAYPPAALDAVRKQSERIPLFLFPDHGETGFSADGTRVMDALGLSGVTFAEPRPIRTYDFADDELMWPFRGVRLAEQHDRVAAAVAPEARGIDPLISSDRGCIFFRSRGGPQVYVSTASLLEAVSATRLQDEFRPARFAGLLPLLLFARSVMGDAGWRTPRVRANVMIDDPNLRFMRYGFLDYRELVNVAELRQLHFAIAMSPIDYKKTRPHVARLMEDNRRHISLVPHGVEHLKDEFERDVAIEKAVMTLEDGLDRMRIHREACGVGFPRAMTFPHGGCNATWLEAMRRTGFHATFAARALPFKPEADIRDPLYQMYPAEMTFRGFPIVNRYAAEQPKEALLFHAWLGKPLAIYTHHAFFRDGMDRMLDITDFLTRQVGPAWGSVESMLNGNYQWRRSGDTREIRVFSNSVTLAADQPVSVVLKADGSAAQEVARVDGAEVRVAEHDGHSLVINDPTMAHDHITVSFDPRPTVGCTRSYRTPLWARVRRLAIEIRDHTSAIASRT